MRLLAWNAFKNMIYPQALTTLAIILVFANFVMVSIELGLHAAVRAQENNYMIPEIGGENTSCLTYKGWVYERKNQTIV